ncbi:Casein kinase I [Tritrichomonas foetus]|uniref:non-specific serine/threonine protein kinase n=1 Tax=Tritrichomonas foetus TaxID=1144522 RepID=A0A1J4KNC8_9EUKA|nr:Casein kinase I [Tritrichomonas foetus]|eukprot:OHT12626.1 Casein kinase I [Tritrichomonas foetus]
MSLVPPKEGRTIFPPGEKIGKYVIKRLIGQGGYGDIYEVTDESDKSFAMKVEYVASPKQALSFERKILEELKDSSLFAHIHFFGIETHFRYLIMDLLGPSISNTRREMPKHKYSLFSALRISVFMLQCIEDLHKHGYVHCDIKPGNFLLKAGTNKPLALIDYGLSRQYIDPKTKEPFAERHKCGFVGTTKYASLNVHQGMDTSPRDDLSSWIYSTIEMVDGKLPWTSISELKKIKRMKYQIPVGKLLSSLPSQYLEIYDYVKNLQFLDQPNYQFLYTLLDEAIKTIGDPKTIPFDWESFNQEKINGFSAIEKLPKAADCELFDVDYSLMKSAQSSNSRCCLLL